MPDTSKLNKEQLLKNFATGCVPTEDDFTALINLADSSATALGMDATADLSKPAGDGSLLGGLQVKGGKLTVVTDPNGPLNVKAGVMTLAYSEAHLEVEGDKEKALGLHINLKGGLAIAPDEKGKGLMVSYGPGLTLMSDGKLAVDAGAGLAPDPNDANKMSVKVGKGLALDTQAPNALIVNVSQKGGLDFDGTALKIKLPAGSALTQDTGGLNLPADALKKMSEDGSMKRFRETVSKAYPGHFLNKIPQTAYPDIRTCFEKMFAYALTNKWNKDRIIKGARILAPSYSGLKDTFRLLKPDNTVISGEDDSTGKFGACLFDKQGSEYFGYEFTQPGFFIAVGSVDDQGNYLKPSEKEKAKLTENALLMFKDDVSISVLGWWDMNVLLNKAVTSDVPALETGWQACTPVVLSASQPWETVINSLYTHQDEIAALKMRLEFILGTNSKKRSPSLSLGLESQGDDVFVCSSTGERAMGTDHMWIVKSDTQELGGHEQQSLNNADKWAKGCYLFLGETDDQETLVIQASHFTRNALVVWVGDKNGTTGKADVVRVVGSFNLSEDGKHAQWQPVMPGVMAQGAERLREAMNRVTPSLAVKGIVAEDYVQIDQCFGKLLDYAKTNGWHEGDILTGSMLRTQPYNDAYYTFQLKKPDGSFVEGEGDSGVCVFDASGYHRLKYEGLPEKFSIAVGSVTDAGNYSKDNHKWTQNALLLFREEKNNKSAVRVIGWWDMSILLKKFYADGMPALGTGWNAWTPLLFHTHQPWDEVITGLFTHQYEIAALKSRLDYVLGAEPSKHNPPIASLCVEKRGDTTIITNSFGESAMGSNLGWLFLSTTEEYHSPYKNLENWSQGCYLFIAHTDDNGSFAGGKTRYTKNALIIEVGPNPTKQNPEYIRVIGNFILTEDGKRADWQPLVEGSSGDVQDIPTIRKALADKLKPLMQQNQPLNDYIRINVSLSSEHTITSLYYDKEKKYTADCLRVYRMGQEGVQNVTENDIRKWTNGWYAVAGALDDHGLLPLKGGKNTTANALMLGKFGEIVTVIGYWDLVDLGKNPVWYQTEPDPVLYDTSRDSAALELLFGGKATAAEGKTFTQVIAETEKDNVHPVVSNRGNGQSTEVKSSDNTIASFDNNGNIIFHKWGAPITITATQPATRRKNKKSLSFLLKLDPHGPNGITGEIPNERYARDDLSVLVEKFKNIKSSNNSTLSWSSSSSGILNVVGGQLVAGSSSFTPTEIKLTAKSSSSDFLQGAEKEFTFTFCEHKIKENTFSLMMNRVDKDDDTMDILIRCSKGSGIVPDLKSEVYKDYTFDKFNDTGNCWEYRRNKADANNSMVRDVYFGDLTVSQTGWNGYGPKSITFKLDVNENKKEDTTPVKAGKARNTLEVRKAVWTKYQDGPVHMYIITTLGSGEIPSVMDNGYTIRFFTFQKCHVDGLPGWYGQCDNCVFNESAEERFKKDFEVSQGGNEEMEVYEGTTLFTRVSTDEVPDVS